MLRLATLRRNQTGATSAEYIVIAGLMVAIIVGIMVTFRTELSTAIATLGCRVSSGASGSGDGCGGASATAGGTPSASGNASGGRTSALAGGMVAVPPAGTAPGGGRTPGSAAGATGPSGATGPAGLSTTAGMAGNLAGGLAANLSGANSAPGSTAGSGPGTTLGSAPGGGPAGNSMAGNLTGNLTGALAANLAGSSTGNIADNLPGAGLGGRTGPNRGDMNAPIPADLPGGDIPGSGSRNAPGAPPGGAGRGAAAPNPALALPNFKDAKHFQNNPADAGTYDERPVNGDLFVPDRFATGDDAKRDIRANDVAQGMLGDCYWLSALATMAETNPDVIRNAIKDNGNGTYDVTFYDNNRIPFTITVDNKFPVKRRNGSTPFAAPGDVSKDNKRELWVMIMEKAWAKAKGSFGHSEGGFGAPAMEALSGKPSQWYALNAGNIPGKATGVLDFKVLEDAAKKGYAMTTGSLNKNAAQHNPYYQGPNPLVSSHEYYISAVDPVKKTITIQNPWGWHKHERVMTYAEFKAAFEDVGINPGSKK